MRYRDGAWRLTVQADGRRHYATVKAPDNRTGERTAAKALAALVTEVDQGQHLGDATTTVGQLLDAWLAHHGPSLEAGTAAGYRQTVAKHLRPTLGDTLLVLSAPRGEPVDLIGVGAVDFDAIGLELSHEAGRRVLFDGRGVITAGREHQEGCHPRCIQ